MSNYKTNEIKKDDFQSIGKPEYSIIFKIILPFWIDLPHKTKLQKKFNKNSYEIQIFQDLWKIHWRTWIRSSFFIITEEDAIDINYLKPKLNFDHLNPFLDSDIYSELEQVYYPEKLKTLLQVSIELKNINSRKELINFLKDQDNWQDIKNIINYFLSIYTYIRINSNFTDHRILPIGDNYYTNENVLVSFKKSPNNIEEYIIEASSYLNLPAETYHPMYKCNDSTLGYFKEKYEKGEKLKLRLHERLRILIDNAKKSRDINSLIIYNTIYLERVSIQYLLKKREIDVPELEILYKAKGLSHFVEDQLPHFLENQVEPEIIKDAIELVRKRNEIIHLGVVFVYSNELELKCYNVLKLISYLESVIISKDSPDFIFEPYITGVIREIHENNIAKIELFHSLKESEYHKEFNIRLDKIPEETLRSINQISKDFKNFELPKLFPGVFKVFYKANDYIINFSLNPTQLEQNIEFFQKLIEYLKDKITPSELKIFILFNNIPPGNLDLSFKLLKDRINQMKQKYGLEEIKVITFQFIVNQEEAEIFQNIINCFKNKNVELLSKKELLSQPIKKEKIEDVIRKYPIVFVSQITDNDEYIKLTEWFSNAYGFKKFNNK